MQSKERTQARKTRRGDSPVRLKPNRRCGPPSVRAIGEGEGNDAKEAVGKAAENARTYAGALCHGKCDETGMNCEYTETDVSLTKPPAAVPNSNPVKYRAEVTSIGKCECQ